MLSTGVAGHVFNTPSSCHYGSLEPAVSSLRPIWHRVFVSRGGISHPINGNTKILPAFAGVPGVLAPVGISPFPRLYRAWPRSPRKQNLQYLATPPLLDKLFANCSTLFSALVLVRERERPVRDLSERWTSTSQPVPGGHRLFRGASIETVASRRLRRHQRQRLRAWLIAIR